MCNIAVTAAKFLILLQNNTSWMHNNYLLIYSAFHHTVTVY